MKSLAEPDLAALHAAQEMLKQGQPLGAHAELGKIGSESQAHPDVLEAQWEVCAQSANWAGALEIAKILCDILPASELGWLYHACSLKELHRTQEAFEVLEAGFEKFPNAPALSYNLACCACRLGRVKEASFWLAKAAKVGGRAEVKLMALGDDDLAPLLDEICAM